VILFATVAHLSRARSDTPLSAVLYLVNATGAPEERSSAGYLFYENASGARGFVCDRAMQGVQAEDVCSSAVASVSVGASWAPAAWIIPEPRASM